jgi:hypothetical protein
LEEFFNAVRNAQAPERFTNTFLKDLEFTSSNDRLYIGVLKGLGFLDEGGAPRERYFAFLDPANSRIVLAEAIREAYSDLFAINRTANELSLDDVRGKFKTLTRGQKSENVIKWMANTFTALCALADWTLSPSPPPPPPPPQPETPETPPASLPNPNPAITPPVPPMTGQPLQLHYNIQLILPEVRDPAVYDALFSSLRRHLT